ncbi:hypothetical protein [Halorhabdus rudnickae]|uniref:hypothetical protein n=1 Tax=Halorhabdus rudnickae TaxID=1775544 RepID=UPI001083C312|nr:hypothetical protein [Halorhabdus rudnickae]
MTATVDTSECDMSEIEKKALEVIDRVRTGDRILFNDRVQPLEVTRQEGLHEGNFGSAWAKLKGPQGGRYKIRYHDGSAGEYVTVGRREGANEDGFPVYDFFELTDIEIVDHHEFRIGQMFEDNDGPFDYLIVTKLPDNGFHDAELVRIRTKEGEVASATESGLFGSRARERIFAGELELIREYKFGYGDRGIHYDTEREEKVRLSGPHKRGVDLRPVDGNGLEVVDWETILFGFDNRFVDSE